MKNYLLAAMLLMTSIAIAQRERTQSFGQQNMEELKMKVYQKDSLAPALVLFEQANYYLDEFNNFDFVTDYYHRIKIFDKDKGQKYTNIVIYTRKTDVVKDIKGVTYNWVNNSVNTTSIVPTEVFTTPVTKNVNKTTFTLPNIQDGSVIEYSYKIVESTIVIRDWYFQSDIPKLESRYDLAVMGNYQYNTRLVGFEELTTNEAKSVPACLTVPDQDDFIRRRKIPCASYAYGMKDVPALKTESYMLSPKNYLSRISFDLKSITSMVRKTGVSQYQQGVTKKVKNYTKTWKDADKALKLDFLNNQGSKKAFFKKKLPKELFGISDDLQKAKSIYSFIQKHYTWNEKNWVSSNIHVKENFDTRVGSVDEINLSLYNSLQAAKIESYITLVSTRSNGIPTKLFPTIDDFNYLIVKVVVNGQDFFLDASNKQLPFGLIPFKCLNGEARVFDFKKGSYWQDLKVTKPSVKKINSKLYFDASGVLISDITINNNLYYAESIRSRVNQMGEDAFVSSKEQGFIESEIENYEASNLEDLSKPVIEKMKVVGDEPLGNAKRINIYPMHEVVKTNPFKLNERLYPVDFGYARSISQRTSIAIPEGYKVVSIPKQMGFRLPGGAGSLLFRVQQKEQVVNIFLKRQLSKNVFTSNEYFYLKKFYDELIKIHGSFITIEKQE